MVTKITKQIQPLKGALSVALAYAALGAIWILYTDMLVAAHVSNAEALSSMQTYKGWFYVTVTGLLLFYFVYRQLKQIALAQQDLRTSHLLLMEAHEQLKVNQAQLVQAEKLASIGQFAAGVVHEIASPLTYLNVSLEVLSEYASTVLPKVQQLPDDEDTVVELVANCQDCVDRIEGIVTDLRTYAHPGKESFSDVDVNEVVEASLRIAHSELKHKARVTQDLAPLPKLQGNPQRLSQVFINLLVNAAQSMDGNSGTIHISTGLRDSRVFVRITDDGAGIPSKELPKLFEPFFTSKEAGKGTGLGLSVALSIVHRHKGTIDVDSVLGNGTTFTVLLPLATPEAASE